MRNRLALCAAIAAATTAFGASTPSLPTLSTIAESLDALTGRVEARLAETSNRLAQAEAQNTALSSRIYAMEEFRDFVVLFVEGDKGMRERWHGGRLGQYIVTNDTGRIIRVDLYADGDAWTNGTTTAVRVTDPEARAKELARIAEESERIKSAWEAANLPPDLAALRAAQRERERQNAAAEAK